MNSPLIVTDNGGIVNHLEILIEDIKDAIDSNALPAHAGIIAESIETIKSVIIANSMPYVDDMNNEWMVVERDTTDTYNRMCSLIRKEYFDMCKTIDSFSKPVQPFFMITKYTLAYYTSGFESVVPLFISSFS